MTVIIKKQLTPEIYFAEPMITLPGEPQEVELTYAVLRIVSFDNNMVTAEYSVAMNGVASTETILRMFAYSGSGNPIDQAEDQLRAWLSELPGVVLEDGSVITSPAVDEAETTTVASDPAPAA